MGIDYYSCSECETSFPDVIDYKFCECGRDWCDEECAELGGLQSDEWGDDRTCKYCREEEFDDAVLLAHLLLVMEMTREELIAGYKKWESIVDDKL